MNSSLVMVALVLLSGFALLSRRLRQARAGRMPAWVFMLAACVPGLILGAVATGASSFYEPSWKPIAPLICDGRIENLSRTSSYQAPMSRAHEAGLTTVSTMLYCVDASGDRQPVTGRFMAVSTLVYGGAFSLLLLWLFTRRRSSPTRTGSPLVASTRNTSTTSRTADADVADKVRQLAQRLAGSSPRSDAINTFVTINGRAVDPAVAEKVRQLALRLVGSPTRNDASDIARDMLERAGIAPAGNELDARLRQLKHLYDRRLITDAEYAARKADLLSQL